MTGNGRFFVRGGRSWPELSSPRPVLRKEGQSPPCPTPQDAQIPGAPTDHGSFSPARSARLRGPATLPPMDDALSTPLPGLSLLQRLLWPLIFVQLVALRDRLRARYGGNMPSWLSLSKSGCAGLIRVPTDSAIRQAAPASYETFGHDYSARLTRARLADVCAEEETPPAPRRALRSPSSCPGRNRGRPPFNKDGPTPTRPDLICRARITGA